MGRIPELDALRGLAATFIILFHLRFMGAFPWWGTFVDLFFVLSGYLITTIILQKAHTKHFLRTFYARRSLRIFPTYYLTIGLVLALNCVVAHPDPIDGLGHHLAYLQNSPGYWWGTIPSFTRTFQHSWTLAIEEQFYLVWPPLVLFLGRRWLLAAIVPALLLMIVARAWGLDWRLLATRGDGLILGALLAYLLLDREAVARHKRMYSGVFATMAVVPPAFWFLKGAALAAWTRLWPGPDWVTICEPLNTLRIALAYFGMVGLVRLHAGHRWLSPLRWRCLIYVGSISYGLYLYHPLVFVAVTNLHVRLGLRGSAGMDLVKVVACFALASASWEGLEKPLLRLKDRFAYARDSGRYRGPH